MELADRYEAMGCRIRQRAKQHGVDDAEDRGVGADAESQRQYDRGRESGILPQDANRIGDVLTQRIQKRQTSAGPVALRRLCVRAQRDDRARAGLRVLRSGVQAVVEVELQMRFQLVGALAIVSATREEIRDAQAERSNRSHGPPYSSRRAAIGSTRAARRAGM